MVADVGSPQRFQRSDGIVDARHPHVAALAAALRRRHGTDVGFARAAFEWVRDEVAHSYDARDSRVTLVASDVLRERVGLCYGKSHLLAALLRSQGIPAALCYQRLGSTDEGWFVHGLVAVHLAGAWHRQDPRGNTKPGVDAEFSLGREQLAYPVDLSRGECDYARLYEAAAPEIVTALLRAEDALTCALPSDLATTGA